jgi:uncharacterized protein YjdB
MWRIGRTLATVVAVALSSWSCGSTAPDATPQVATIVVSPATSTLALNAQLPLQAQVQDGSGSPIPGASVTWTVQDPKIVSVSAAGVVTALALGSSQVAASALGRSGIATITVTRTPVANVVLLPNRIDAAVGSTTQLSATAFDGSGNALTDRAIIWSSSNQAVASVSNNGLVTAVAPGTATITAASEGKTSTSTVTVAQGAVAKVIVSPSPVTMVAGQSAQLALSVRDAADNVITGKSAIWASSNTAVATVASDGTVKAIAAGSSTITATVDGVSGSSALTVSSIPVGSISLSPTTATVSTGSSTTLTTTVKDANGAVVTDRVVTWTSSNPLIAIVSQSGVVTGVAPGTATITATSETKSANATVTVTLVPVGGVQVAPPSVSIVAGQGTTLSATVTDANGVVVTNRPVTWSTSDSRVATVLQTGAVTAVAVGTATITAASGAATGTSTVTVTAAPVQSVSVSPTTLSLVQGQTGTLSATVVDATGATLSNPSVAWSSRNPAVASVDAITGVVTAVGVGSTTIDASSGGKTGSSSVTVTAPPIASITISPSSSNVTAGQAVTLTATVKDAAGNVVTGSTVAWSSSDVQIAAPLSTGQLTADVATSIAGSATVTASVNGVQGTATIDVSPGAVSTVTVTAPSKNLKPGNTMQLTATATDSKGNTVPNQSFLWVSSNPTLATVSATGLVTGKRNGNVTITASTALIGGKSGSFAITVK